MAQKFPHREKRKQEEDKVSLKEKLYRCLDIAPDCLPGSTWVEIRSQTVMTVKGCGKILLYTPEEIRIELKKGYLSVCGKRLACTSYYANAVAIDGCIRCVSFEEA